MEANSGSTLPRVHHESPDGADIAGQWITKPPSFNHRIAGLNRNDGIAGVGKPLEGKVGGAGGVAKRVMVFAIE